MCNEQAQTNVGAAAPMDYFAGATSGMQAAKSNRDPMWMPLQGLINEWHQREKEISFLRIELANAKVRVAELERDKALRIG